MFRGRTCDKSQGLNPNASGRPTEGGSWRTVQMDGKVDAQRGVRPWRLTSNQLPLIVNFSRSCRYTLHGIVAFTNYPRTEGRERVNRLRVNIAETSQDLSR